jgi:uncharacterized protein (DUF934 family)
MPIVRVGRFQPDPFIRIGADWELPLDSSDLGKVIVPFDWLDELANQWLTNGQIGVDVARTARVQDLSRHLPRLALVAIGFPVFSDGRGFSLAKALRNWGYRGILRARGALIIDQSYQARACGFDEIEIPAASSMRQSEPQWLAAATEPPSYQRSRASPAIFLTSDARRAIRRSDRLSAARRCAHYSARTLRLLPTQEPPRYGRIVNAARESP